MFLRRHWIVVLKLLGISLCLVLIPVFFFIIYINYTDYFENEIVTAIIILLTSAFYLFIILYTFSSFVDYYLDVWIVTNQRIINIEQKGLFARVVSEKDLGRMQDITSDIEGFWATVLNYGDVHIQTAGEKERFIFKQVPFADEVSRRISNLVSEYQKINKDTPLDKVG